MFAFLYYGRNPKNQVIMLHTILTDNSLLRDAFIQVLSLEPRTDSLGEIAFFQKGAWVLGYAPIITNETIDDFAEEYGSMRVFLAETGRSIDTVHETGDIVLPNVFLTYNPLIEMSEINESNRDALMGKAEFLDIFEKQTDYYVEDFGLSIGGIAVLGTPNKKEIAEKLMTVYEADVYTDKKTVISNKNDKPYETLFLFGIAEGKKSERHEKIEIHTLLSKNMIDTVKLFDEHLEKTSDE